MTLKKIELLSPAKDKICGIEAINHGADAVYIGAPRFGARYSAGNTVADIEELAAYAHRYHAKVYVALNTILNDEELPEAEKIIHNLYRAGTDAFIIQDMGLLQLDLPPVEFHASTQTDNRTPEKIRFLEQVGFTQAVLARELSLEQIREIRAASGIDLEFFVHGALCVSYSGQCYVSQAFAGRSANRGQCAQYCRLPYTLKDAEGKIIMKDKHLLSLKDLNLSDYLRELINAGISSFKIEGRLKDVSYVKNITAYYRRKLDIILDQKGDKFIKASSGKVDFFFQPSPDKSFNRGFTSYFLDERQKNMISPDTPKSTGEYLGEVSCVYENAFSLKTGKELHNGDGLCYFDKTGMLKGFYINRFESNKIYIQDTSGIYRGTKIYRNQDHIFEQNLKKKSADRRISVNIIFRETGSGFEIKVDDMEGSRISFPVVYSKELARQAQKENIIRILGKLGDTPFIANEIVVDTSADYFIPTSLMNDWRRQAMNVLFDEREKKRIAQRRISILRKDVTFPQKSLTYLGNVYNKKAIEFYHLSGVADISPAFEKQNLSGIPVMFTKYCILYELGICKKKQPHQLLEWKEPFYLYEKKNRLKVVCDCSACEMHLISE